MMTSKLYSSVAALGVALLLAGCESSQPAGPPPPPPIAPAPAGTPAFSVLKDTVSADRDHVDVRVALTGAAEREELDKLLQHLYRQMMTRLGVEPLTVAAHVYPSAEAFQRDPDKGAVASVVKKRGDLGPTFDNRVPLSFPKQVGAVISTDTFVGEKKPKLDVDEAQKGVTLTVPYTEPGQDAWRETLTYGSAVTDFLDYAQRLYDGVPALEKLTFVGVHKGAEVLRVRLSSRAEFESLAARDLQERIGAQQGRAFAQLSLGKMSDAAVAKEKAARAKKVYQEALGRLPKDAVTVSKKLP